MLTGRGSGTLVPTEGIHVSKGNQAASEISYIPEIKKKKTHTSRLLVSECMVST